MEGTLLGNIISVLYFLLFQLCGVAVSFSILKTERNAVKLLFGSVLGSVMLSWLPVPFSFVFGFAITSHILAALSAVILAIVSVFVRKPRLSLKKSDICLPALIVLVPTFLIFTFLVLHSFRVSGDSVSSSQSTYGDMSMHLGFISSIAEQKIFPPEYSILPGTKLSYPFLSDSISSSMYIFGASLRLSYAFPMIFAGLQVFSGALLLLRCWLGKTHKAILAFLLLFFCGGFGFAYFVSSDPGDFASIFTSFYTTPTNYTAGNIRWVNLIVDMLLPQRATLFGYAVLFAALYLLYKAVYRGKKEYFVYSGVLGAALPMIHTHSFLALGLISGMWLFCELWRRAELTRSALSKGIKIFFTVFLIVMPFLQWIINANGLEDSNLLLYAVGLCGILFLGTGAYLLFRAARAGKATGLLRGWGVMLLIVVVFALPQLLFWTFSQAAGGSFLRGHFGWANEGDNYLWFYIKNVGITALLALPALWASGDKNVFTASPFILILFICEFVVFQPNSYDNNKLLYIAFFFLCGIVSDYACRIYESIKVIPGKKILAALFVFFSVFSASLTIVREAVSDYTLFTPEQLAVEKFAEENTEPGDVFLTSTRHNNEIAALSGRNIICGSTVYVHFHGLDYYQAYQDVKTMYESPATSAGLFKKYSVDYVVISKYEVNDYGADKNVFFELYPCYYTKGDSYVFKVSE